MKKSASIAALLLSTMFLTGCAASGNDGIIGDGSTPETEEITFSPASAFADVVCSAEEALKWAEENHVKRIDVEQMQIINDKRSKEKDKK